jgi:hypothetical protein
MVLNDYVQLATMFGLIITAFFTIINYLHSRKVLDENRLSEKRKILIARLNEFYGPLLTYLSVVDSLHRLFYIGKPPEFRTLTFLLDPEQEYQTSTGRSKVVLSDSDRMILEEILELEDKTEQHIIKSCGLVEDSRLAFSYVPDPTKTDVDPKVFENLGLLSILVSHFRVLRMAYEKKISAEVERYKSYVYPRELNGILRANITELQSQLRDLGGLVPGSLNHVSHK